MRTHRVYRALTLLYPKEFRSHYRDDLILQHADYAARRGNVPAWTRSSADLLVTVPLYRLEAIMNPTRSSIILTLGVGLLAVVGLAAITVLPVLGLGLIAVAALVAIAQRGRLANAIKTPGVSRRRRRLTLSASLAVLAVAVLAVGIVDLGGREEWGDRVIVYNIAFLTVVLSAFTALIAGLVAEGGRSHAR